jgi:hypothetical protein
METQAIFLNPFAVSSLCERKFIVRPFVEETNGLNGLAHPCNYNSNNVQ